MEGYLWKQGDKGLVKSWRRRFFVLDNDKLFYFKDKGEPLLGYILLSQATSVTPNERAHAKDGFGFQIDTKQRIWYLSATSATERDKWIRAIQLHIPGYKTLHQKQTQSSNSLSETTLSVPSTVTIASARSNNILNNKVISSSSSEQQQININNRKSFDESGPVIFQFEEDLDKPVTKFPIDDDLEIDDESNRTPEKSDLKETEVVNIKSSNQNDNFALPKEMKFPVACSVPVDIPLRRFTSTLHSRNELHSHTKNLTSHLDHSQISDDDDDEDDDNTQNFQKPHELAAKTYQEHYLRNGLELDVPVRKHHIKTLL